MESILSSYSFDILGNLGNEALIVTRDDEVFALGSNGAGCLGLGDMHSTLAPKQVEPLCYKVDLRGINIHLPLETFLLQKVVGFAYGSGPHVLAYTESGELYSWGHNGYCQLGNGSTNQGLTPAIIQNSLLGRKVVQVVFFSIRFYPYICLNDRLHVEAIILCV